MYNNIYMIEQEVPQPLAGSAKGSGCLLPQILGNIKSVVD